MKENAYLLTWRGDVFRDASDSPLNVNRVNSISEMQTLIQNHTQNGVKMPLRMGLYQAETPLVSQELRFWVQPKLMYYDDIQQIIDKNFVSGTKIGFDRYRHLEKWPMVFQFKTMAEHGMHYVYYVDCRPLTPNDLVVNAKMEQIWPERTGMPPVQITNMFNTSLSERYDRQTGQFSNGIGRIYQKSVLRDLWRKICPSREYGG